MPPFILSLIASPLGRKVALIGAACLAVLVAVWRIFAAGKRSQRNEDAAVTATVIEDQREIAAKPLDTGAARDKLRAGRL